MTELIALALLVVVGWLFVKKPFSSQEKIRNKAKKEAVSTSQKLLSERDNWVIVDFETTGLSETDVALSVGVIDADGKVLLDTLIALPHRKRISAKAKEIHGISREDLKGAPQWSEVRQMFSQAVNGKTCIAYNAKFDSRILKQTDAAHGIKEASPPWIDLMALYNLYCAEWDPRRKAFKYQKLPGATHGATADCNAALVLIERMASG